MAKLDPSLCRFYTEYHCHTDTLNTCASCEGDPCEMYDKVCNFCEDLNEADEYECESLSMSIRWNEHGQ